MSQREDKINKLLEFPHDAFLMIRLEYVQILSDELEAKLLRIIEKYVEQARKNIYQRMLNTAGMSPSETVEVTKDIWVPISYRLFMNDLFDTVKSENTLKRALADMERKQIIFHRYQPKKKYDAPEYKLNIVVLQGLLNILKSPGYQKLIPSILDTLKNLYPQKLTPSGYQELISSIVKSRSEGKSRVSENDTNITEDYDNNSDSITEEDISSSSEDDAPANITHFETEKKKRDTNPSLPAVKSSHSQGLSESPTQEKGASLDRSHTSDTRISLPGPLSDRISDPLPVSTDGSQERERERIGASHATHPLHSGLSSDGASVAAPDGERVPPAATPGAVGELAEDVVRVTGTRPEASSNGHDEKPPMALTARQIQKQLEQRQEQILALYATKIGRKPSRSKANLDGALKLAQDDATDEDIGTTIDAILADSFLAKNLNLTFVHTKLDALANKPTPMPTKPKTPTSKADQYGNDYSVQGMMAHSKPLAV